MGQNSSKSAQLPVDSSSLSSSKVVPLPVSPGGFGRAQTMLDVTQAAQITSGGDAPGSVASGLQRSSSDTALNTSTQTACQKAYQQSLEWGRNEQFLKLAHTFHTNNY